MSKHQTSISIKRDTAPQLANGIFVSNSVSKDFLLIDFLYNCILTEMNNNGISHGHSNSNVHVLASVMLDKEIVEELNKQLTEYLNYANNK